MTRYATALAGDPAQTYRSVDLAARTGGADPHALVSLLYEEAIRALRSAAWATNNRQYAMKGERVTRATAILFALEAAWITKRAATCRRRCRGSTPACASRSSMRASGRMPSRS